MINWKNINFPKKPGVYFFKNKYHQILYIGKSKNLYKRVLQYKANQLNSFKTPKLLEKSCILDYQVCKTNNQAIILEKQLINHHRPLYNIELLDNKRFFYIYINLVNDKLILKLVRSKENNIGLYFGPFVVSKTGRRLFEYFERICFYNKGIKKTFISKEEHKKNYLFLKELFFNNTNNFTTLLSEKMLEASKNLNFELANDYKLSIEAINSIFKSSFWSIRSKENVHFFNYYKIKNKLYIKMLFFFNKKLLSEYNKEIDIVENLQITIRQFLSLFYGQNKKPFVFVSKINKKILKELNLNTIIEKNNIDNFKQILNSIKLNLKQNFENNGNKNYLKKILNIKTLNKIVINDNSFLTNSNTGVSVFLEFVNFKQNLKNTKIFVFDHNKNFDDLRLLKKGLEKFLLTSEYKSIDLLVLDGNIRQINVAKEVLNKKNIPLRTIALQKNKKHKTEYIVTPKNIKINCTNNNKLLFFVKIQELVDKVAKKYFNKKTLKNNFSSKLSSIKGIGQKTENKLLNHFNTYHNIYNASIDELSKAVSKKIAKKINLLNKL